MKLKALRALRYASKSVLKGSVFECKPVDARLLVAAKIAENYVEPAPIVRKPVPAVVQQRVDAMVENGSITQTQAEQVLEHHSTHEPTEPAAKRQYKRRDMTAE